VGLGNHQCYWPGLQAPSQCCDSLFLPGHVSPPHFHEGGGEPPHLFQHNFCGGTPSLLPLQNFGPPKNPFALRVPPGFSFLFWNNRVSARGGGVIPFRLGPSLGSICPSGFVSTWGLKGSCFFFFAFRHLETGGTQVGKGLWIFFFPPRLSGIRFLSPVRVPWKRPRPPSPLVFRETTSGLVNCPPF